MRRRTDILATGFIALTGGLIVWIIATQVFPHHSLNHDEAVYLQQAALLREGQLNLWPPLDDVFRPWFFVEDGNRLYPKYSPVPAAMFLLGRFVGGYRLALVAIATANLALVAAVVREVFDRSTGILAAGFLLMCPLFLIDSAVFLPYAPTTLLNLLFAYGYFRAERTADRPWAIIAGTAIGLAFFARPYTAVLFAMPFIIHALWSLYSDGRSSLERMAIIGTLGLAGVGTTLGYNGYITGSYWLFPYQAFARQDGLGFGYRQILAHDIQYTPELAVRANFTVVELFFFEWIAGGVIGAILVVAGILHTLRNRRSARAGVLVGLFVSIIVGNVYFWGNLNILGDIDRAGDGLVSALGPYYHFDLLLPTAAFAAVGTLWGSRLCCRTCKRHLDQRVVRLLLIIVLVASLSIGGAITANNLEARLETNMEATSTYETAYEPFAGGPPTDSLILLPDPYGDWLNHPFQPLRNEPGFEGPAVFAIDDQPFAVVNQFPNRRVYRYGYRGPWAPHAGSPTAARLQRVRDVSGPSVALQTTVGIPDGAVGITVRLATTDGSRYYVAPDVAENLTIKLQLSNERARVTGDIQPVGKQTVSIAGRETLRLSVFVDYGPPGGFSYRFDLPVDVSQDEVRALSPRIELCRNANNCGGAATYIPSAAQPGAKAQTELSARDPNS